MSSTEDGDIVFGQGSQGKVSWTPETEVAFEERAEFEEEVLKWVMSRAVGEEQDWQIKLRHQLFWGTREAGIINHTPGGGQQKSPRDLEDKDLA